MNKGAESRPARVREFTLEEIDGELLLYHPGLTRTLYCNATAALVWRLIDGSRTVGDIVALLSDSYPGEPVQEDVERSLAEFEHHGAIAWV